MYGSKVVTPLFAAFISALLGCANPGAQVMNARNKQAEEVRELSQEETQLANQQSREQADLDNKQAEARAKLQRNEGQDVANANVNLRMARADMSEDVQAFVAEIDGRIARAQIALKRSDDTVAQFPKRSGYEFTRRRQEANAKHEWAQEKRQWLLSTDASAWKTNRDSAQKATDELEEAVRRVEGAVRG